MNTSPHLIGLGLASMLMCASGCPGEVDLQPPDENATGGEDTGSGSSDGGPAECPDNPDPECTTANACGNNEICVACECVPEPEGCDDPAAANCISSDDCPTNQVCSNCVCESMCDETAPNECLVDSDCPSGACILDAINLCVCEGGMECDVVAGDCLDDSFCSENEQCVDCACVSTCECDAQDNPCEDPGLSCDGCNCVACGSGEASPVIRSLGQTTPEIVVFGTMISASVTGEAGECPDSLCVVEITNNFPFEVFFNAVNNPIIDPVYLTPDEGILPAKGTTILELTSNACDVPGAVMDAIFFQDPIDLIEYGRVDIAIDLTLPGA